MVVFSHLGCFPVSNRVVEIDCGDAGLLSNIMELVGTGFFKDTFEKLNSIASQEIMTWSLKIIHRPCCKQFHLGSISFVS